MAFSCSTHYPFNASSQPITKIKRPFDFILLYILPYQIKTICRHIYRFFFFFALFFLWKRGNKNKQNYRHLYKKTDTPSNDVTGTRLIIDIPSITFVLIRLFTLSLSFFASCPSLTIADDRLSSKGPPEFTTNFLSLAFSL